ncbi:hypothetical protein K3N28_06255 [Glycomyces sp. TRM65418]|uniref:SRPBCC family protein n=1 Tax=Glycomyces sp. TRM65418 TaxID=2867006 RepID=UPI001CE704D7|nr:hypothetical protein [Glycomyces sp. TRM65418]MCC3762670.1 hypothetical protein [Glycomyces sp. TRM65418]QZD56706.1 hypothetical protein K3N28_06205 [Glycomyces sp. TRM65418]
MNDDGTSATPRIQVTVAAPADEVWRSLRDRGVIRQWHGWDAAELDAEIDSIYFTDVVEDAERRTLIANGGDRFEVRPHGSGARVTLTRAPLSGNPDWDAYYDEVTEGWTTFMHQLRFAVERQPGATRRTLLFSGPDAALEAVTGRLRLDGPVGAPPGTRYTATVAAQDIAGEVWFRSEHQLGVTVDEWGAGLLVVVGAQASGTGSTGASKVVLSTFGLPVEEFAELERQWADWWRGR